MTFSATRISADTVYDVFADISCHNGAGDEAALSGLVAGTVTVARQAAGEAAVRTFARALASARIHGHHLVVLLGPLVPDSAVLARLVETFALDPLVGAVQPRFAEVCGDLVWPLPRADGGDRPGVSRAGLVPLAPFYLTPERLAACLVLRREVVANFEPDEGFDSVAALLLALLVRMRRCGFRNAVVNRAVVPSELPPADLYPVPPSAEAERLAARYLDIRQAANWFERLPAHRLEPLLGAAHDAACGSPPRLLLDCRGMPGFYNGTANSMLGFLDGLTRISDRWDIHLLLQPEALAFHQLHSRYPRWKLLCHEKAMGHYAAAVRLNQPWSLSEVRTLHDHALLLVFNMLDTIAWDVIYPCAEETETTWRFIARHADGLLYNSAFTAARFNLRFPVAPETMQQVTHHTFAADELTTPDAAVIAKPAEDCILLFGNDFDHKDINRTLTLLCDAFPNNRIVVVGADTAPSPMVSAVPSGKLPEADMERLIASATITVFPSFYEGFGMPVVKSLAYGHTVIVRDLPLWHEIAGHARLPGRLVPFTDPPSLVEAVGRALAGDPLPDALPMAVALAPGEEPARWQDCSRRILTLVEALIEKADGRRWRDRDEAWLD